jgi:hypothetical protein
VSRGIGIARVQISHMAARLIPRGLLVLACFATAVVAVNGALRPTGGIVPSTSAIERELGDAAALKLSTQGYEYPIQVSCAPPAGGPPDPTAVHLVCQVTAVNKRHPRKSPIWVEDVTCDLTISPGTPRCGSSGGDALQ